MGGRSRQNCLHTIGQTDFPTSDHRLSRVFYSIDAEYNVQEAGRPSCSRYVSTHPAPSLPESALPPTSLTLRHVFLGKGTQNYTCANTSSTPVAAGALATLYDISCQVTDPKSRTKFDQKLIPDFLKNFSKPVQDLLPSKAPGASVGVHYFRDGSTPMFVLNDGHFVAAGKVGGCAAPSCATGNENGAAVDWLKLARKQGEVYGGIEEVYRVQTAGGRAPAACSKPGPLTVEYVAEYWMYG
ncbi:hypothetical protein GJ744_006108 [Endocarpon pusillum]|uniref:Malate dehydrogenase n=1 Tax=Endocarpon pusillum TaxID=364733 RepID=A0A8H7APQ7_9EURO|nr:hypothetical protein GJ744_006108 [Endocarpon pusillum]